MVRGSMKMAAASQGRSLSDPDFQAASDALARTVIDDILQKEGVPPLDNIINSDVQSAVEGLKLNRWNWAGTLGDVLPSPLGLGGDYVQISGDTYGEYMLNLTVALLQNFAGLAKYLRVDEPIGTVFDWMWGDLGLDAFGQALGGVAFDVYSYFSSAQQFVDPLVLDLDGDGIETISSNAGIVFDHDGDKIKTGTGWVSPDDGLLVFDRNGDGKITDGTELFGVDFVLSAGGKAENGFMALADLDSNGDGVFDAADDDFTKVRVWRDTNQDGISQASELASLAELKILSISTSSHNAGYNNNGNIITATGTFTQLDSTGNIKEGAVGSINFVKNTFYRDFPDILDLNDVAEALPDMTGAGGVRDLQQAVMQSNVLEAALIAYSNAGSRKDQLSLAGSVLSSWATTSQLGSVVTRIGKLSTGSYNVVFSYSWETPDAANIGTPSSDGYDSNGHREPTAGQLAMKSLLEKIQILEAFTGVEYFRFGKTETGSQSQTDINIIATLGGRQISVAHGTVSTSGTVYVTEANLSLQSQQIDQINKAYDSLVSSLYYSLLVQTRLSNYASLIKVEVGKEGFAVNYSHVLDMLLAESKGDPVKTIVNATELASVLKISGWNDYIESWLAQLSFDQRQLLAAEYSNHNLAFYGAAGADNVQGTSTNDYILGG